MFCNRIDNASGFLLCVVCVFSRVFVCKRTKKIIVHSPRFFVWLFIFFPFKWVKLLLLFLDMSTSLDRSCLGLVPFSKPIILGFPEIGSYMDYVLFIDFSSASTLMAALPAHRQTVLEVVPSFCSFWIHSLFLVECKRVILPNMRGRYPEAYAASCRKH